MSNQAAIIPSKGASAEIKNVERYTPGPNEILIKNIAIATNPVDWKVQKYEIFIKFPHIVGSDVAGVVEEVGEGVTKFKKGDQVWSWLPYLSGQGSKYGAFQEYSVSSVNSTALKPSNVSFEEASTVPLAVYTAAAGLFLDLNIPRPTSPHLPAITPASPVLYVHGGASAVGAATIQLARLSGYRVISAASPKNFDLVKSYGAEAVFDYRDSELAQKVQAAAGKVIEKAYDAISENGTPQLVEKIVAENGEIALVLPVANFTPKQKVYGVKAFHYTATEHSSWLADFVTSAIEANTFKVTRPQVVANGINETQKALDHHASGNVSGYKPVLLV